MSLQRVLIIWYFLANECSGFVQDQQRSHFPRNRRHQGERHRRGALPVDPVDLVTTTTTHAGAAADGNLIYHHVETLLSTMYAATSDVMLKPAHGHSQPLFGPPDPFLSAGKSIAPSAKSLIDMGIQKASDAAAAAVQQQQQQQQGETVTGAVLTAADVRTALSDGWKVLDSNNIHHSENVLPGFSAPGGILPQHNPRLAEETPETFAAQVEWSAKYMNVIDKIPYVAFAYGIVEFFFLRPGLDLYKEDIEDEPSQAFIETVMVTGVRMGVFAALATLTLILFGGG